MQLPVRRDTDLQIDKEDRTWMIHQHNRLSTGNQAYGTFWGAQTLLLTAANTLAPHSWLACCTVVAARKQITAE